MALQCIDEIVKTITVQLPASSIKSSLEIYLPGIQSNLDRASESIQLPCSPEALQRVFTTIRASLGTSMRRSMLQLNSWSHSS
jgi:hypothetical protein